MWLTVDEYAKHIGVTPQTIYRWVAQDSVPHPFTRFGPRAIRIEVPDNYEETTVTKTPAPPLNKTKTVAYCRVSTKDQQEGLKEQKLAILEWTNQHGVTIDETVEEVGSGFNGNRKKLQKLLTRDDVKSIVVEHQDRLIRTNFQLLKPCLNTTTPQLSVSTKETKTPTSCKKSWTSSPQSAEDFMGNEPRNACKKRLVRQQMSSQSNVAPPIKTFMSCIEFNEDGETVLETIGDFYATLRNADYAALLEAEKRDVEKPTKQQRRNLLYTKGVTRREADNIICSNDEQWQLVERTALSNIRSWLVDIENIDSHLEKDTLSPQRRHELVTQRQQLESKILTRKHKGHSVAFGGKRLQLLITRHPDNEEYISERKRKRLFLEFMGDKERAGCNPCLRVCPDTFEVSLRIPQGVQQTHLHFADTRWVKIGHMRPKQGKARLQAVLRKRTSPISYQFVWNQNKKLWRLHFTVTVPATEFGKKANLKRKTTHVAGVDVNASHVDVTVVDSHANVLAVKTFEYGDDTDMGRVSLSVAKFLDHFGVSKVGVENLTGLARGRKSKLVSPKVLNKAVTSMRYSVFLREFTSHGFSYGFRVEKVSPAYTSRNTSQWKEACFGYDRHTKASYLIARRLMGLSIERRTVAESCYANSVWFNEGYAAPFNRQPHYSVVSFKRTPTGVKNVGGSLEKSTA